MPQSDYDPRPFIRKVEGQTPRSNGDVGGWVFAKTMAHYNPHWYVVEKTYGDEMLQFVEHIQKSGFKAFYKGYPYRYVEVDGLAYWLTFGRGAGPTPKGGWIINRKPVDQAGWDHQTGWKKGDP